MNDNYHLKVENYNNLVRDVRSNAIINTDKKAFDNYKSLKKSKSLEKMRMDQIESDLSSLKSDINEIKDLLKSLLK
jgi:uncharacterized protein (DUF342 family)